MDTAVIREAVHELSGVHFMVHDPRSHTVFLGVDGHLAGVDGANMVYKWCSLRFRSFMVLERQCERQCLHFVTCD